MIPFGVGVGDFLAVGKLIGQIAVELREVSLTVISASVADTFHLEWRSSSCLSVSTR